MKIESSDKDTDSELLKFKIFIASNWKSILNCLIASYLLSYGLLTPHVFPLVKGYYKLAVDICGVINWQITIVITVLIVWLLLNFYRKTLKYIDEIPWKNSIYFFCFFSFFLLYFDHPSVFKAYIYSNLQFRLLVSLPLLISLVGTLINFKSERKRLKERKSLTINEDIDCPILSSIDDKFQRKEQAEELANHLLGVSAKESHVFSVEAPWGHGKTSFLNLVERELLEKDKDLPIIKVNPWQVRSADNIVYDFFKKLSIEIGYVSESGNLSEISKQFEKLAKHFGGSHAKGFFAIWNFFKTILGKNKETDLRKKLVEELSKFNKPIIVFVDDFDRLLPNETYELIRAIKSITNLPGLNYAIALDILAVSESLEKNGIKNSDYFLDKIIQTRITLPTVDDTDLEKLWEPIEKLLNEIESDKSRFNSLYSKYFRHLITSPRELKRLLSRLKRNYTRECLKEIDFTDLIGLSIIALKCPELFELIKVNPHLFVPRKYTREATLSEDERKEEVQNVTKKLFVGHRKLLNELTKELFTKETPFPSQDTSLLKKGRICIYQNLHIALRGVIPERYVSNQNSIIFITSKNQSEVTDLLNTNASKLEQLFELIAVDISLLFDKDKIHSLAQVDAIVQEHDLFNKIVSLPSNAVVLDNLPFFRDFMEPCLYEKIWELWMPIIYAINGEGNQETFIQKIIDDNNSKNFLPFIARGLDSLSKNGIYRYKKSKNYLDEKIISYLENISNVEEVLDYPFLGEMITVSRWAYEKFLNSTQTSVKFRPQTFFQPLIDSDKLFPKFMLLAFGAVNHISSPGGSGIDVHEVVLNYISTKDNITNQVNKLLEAEAVVLPEQFKHKSFKERLNMVLEAVISNKTAYHNKVKGYVK